MTPDEIKELLKLKADREAKDPLKHYKPGVTQAQCMASKKMIRMLQSGNRGGKTSHMCVEFALMALRRHPTRTTSKPITLILWTNSREQIRDTLYRKLRVASEIKGPCELYPMIPDYEVEKDHMVNGAGKPVCREISLKNGNRIMFAISGIERSWTFLEGKGYVAAIGIDEQAGTQKLIDECMARLMELNNADNIKEFGGAWFMWAASETKINDSFDNLKAICLDPDRNQDAEFFHIKSSENFAVTSEARERVGQFMSEEAYKIRITGEGNARAATLVYGKQWSDQRHMLPIDHIPSERANLWVGYDPGVTHHTGMCIFCLEPENPMQLIGVKFFLWKGGTAAEDVMHLAKWLAGRRLAGFTYDINLRNKDRGGGPTVLAQMQEKMMEIGISPVGGYWQARKQVNAGIQMVRYYLDPAPDNRSVTPFLVVNPSEESGGKLFRWQMLKYAGHEEKQFTGAGSIIKKDDDLLDPARYVCLQRPSWNRDFQCGIGDATYVYPSQFETKVDVPEILTQDQMQMKRLMELSKRGAAMRSTRRGNGYQSI